MALVERFQKNIDATNLSSGIPLEYIYTAGRAGEKFLTKIRDEGKFTGARCERCDIVHFPPRIFCERCLTRIEDAVVDLPNQGTVHTFTLCHETYDEIAKDKPSLVALIRFEGTCGGIFHRLEGVDPKDCTIGMAVEAVLRPAKERTGSILDIQHFKPV